MQRGTYGKGGLDEVRSTVGQYQYPIKIYPNFDQGAPLPISIEGAHTTYHFFCLPEKKNFLASGWFANEAT